MHAAEDGIYHVQLARARYLPVPTFIIQRNASVGPALASGSASSVRVIDGELCALTLLSLFMQGLHILCLVVTPFASHHPPVQ